MVDFAARRVNMVDSQVRPNDVTRFPVIDAMLDIPREDFVPPAQREIAYAGENIALAPGRVVLEPRTLSKMVDALDIRPDHLVLDLAPGYGYSTAVLARMAQGVVAVEPDATMADEAQHLLSGIDVLNAAVIQGDPAAGCADQGPYDAILINGAVEEIPQALSDQLREGGRIAAIFLEGRLGVARIGHRIEGRINWRYAFNAHAPLLAGFAAPRGFEL